ncbi:MAG: phytanoyl-CoA dioxygenase [Gammaproteobacteria bacterium]|nr:phytanoyl-CoA dioxygenase [Gammaproteobacteria bacterium]|tara:strand:- start:1680 stop:2531 length:852 start_codon:yes stop_codon:yes gene_type:complete
MSDTPSTAGFLTQAQIDQFNRDGYIIADFGFSDADIEALKAALHPCYNPEHLKAPSFGARIQDAWKFIREAHTLATNANVLSALEQLYGRRPLPFQTLNFPVGTQQRTHSDTIHFNSQPSGFMAGVWVALEDIDDNNGPLAYYPGSHLLPEITMQDAGLEAGYQNYGSYEDFIAQHVKQSGIEPAYGLMPKGHALIWHANLLHGGSQQKDPRRTRHSQVTHYFFENCKYYTPMHSTPGKLAYRKPEWIKPGEWQPARQPDPDVVASMSPLARKIAALRRRLGF